MSWEHVWYVDTHFTSEVLEVSSCGVVQNVVRLTDEDLGAITVYGPQQNSYSYVNWPSGAIAFSWQKVCGDLVCKQKT